MTEPGTVIAKGNPRVVRLPRDDKSIMLEGARIIFRNFEGRPDKFNPEKGKRTFGVALDDEAANVLEHDGWNVKRKPPRNDEEEGLNHLSVAVGDGRYPPKVILVTSRNKSYLPFEMIGMLDQMEFESTDVIIRPRRWQDGNGEWHIKAYLKTILVKAYEDPLDAKYSDVPVLGNGAPLGIETSDDPIKVIPGELAGDEDEEP